jgi:hypothetical protein
MMADGNIREYANAQKVNKRALLKIVLEMAIRDT